MRLRIAIACPGMPIDPADPFGRALGGSESAAIAVATELAKLGHESILFCECNKEANINGVRYLPIALYSGFAASTPHDISIVQRQWSLVSHSQMLAKVVLFWAHDLLRKRSADSVTGMCWAIDRVLVVSEWMRWHYFDVAGLPLRSMEVAPNGLDLAGIAAAAALAGPRERKRLLYASRFERGVDVLIEKVMPEIWAEDPEVCVDICGYSHTIAGMADFYRAVMGKIERLEPRVHWLGHLSKEELWRTMYERAALVYPNPSPNVPAFAEVSCMVAMEAMACGLPVITSDNGALRETLGSAGSLIVDGKGTDLDHGAKMAATVLRLLRDPVLRSEVGARGLVEAAGKGWGRTAQAILKVAAEVLAENNADPFRLAAHFAHRQDIEAARQALKHCELEEGTPAAKLRAMIAGRYAFTRSDAAMAAHYDGLGERVKDFPESLKRLENEGHRFTAEGVVPRFGYLAEAIMAAKDVVTLLDYGCGHGECAIVLSNITNVKVQGVDVSGLAIGAAKGFRDRFAKDVEKVRFELIEGLEAFVEAEVAKGTRYDGLVLGEILEHVRDPFHTFDQLARLLRPNALVLVTMPWGPWEADVDNPPQHIREWTKDDLGEVFGAFPKIKIMTSHQGNSVSGEPCGYSLVAFRFDPKASLGAIDWHRKLANQRPTQTLSVNMIVGGDTVHTTLHWSLSAIASLANEIVIADCGMSPEAWRIAQSYGATIIQSSSPLDIGFDAVRNLLLNHSRMDWVLWIDADERLVNAAALRKYLRESNIDAYAIRQHHWSIEGNILPDLPARLIRNRPIYVRPDLCQKPRFFGLVHEHPEVDLNEGLGRVVMLSEVSIGHVGYIEGQARTGRFLRNRPMLLRDCEKYPARRLQKHLMIRDNAILVGKLLQENGGFVDAQVEKLLLEVIDLYRKHYIGRPSKPNVDAFPYYSYACRTLNLGFDATIELATAKEGSADLGPTAFRFASQEDFIAEVVGRIKAQTSPYDDPWW